MAAAEGTVGMLAPVTLCPLTGLLSVLFFRDLAGEWAPRLGRGFGCRFGEVSREALGEVVAEVFEESKGVVEDLFKAGEGVEWEERSLLPDSSASCSDVALVSFALLPSGMVMSRVIRGHYWREAEEGM